jgi:hypothetical protein
VLVPTPAIGWTADGTSSTYTPGDRYWGIVFLLVVYVLAHDPGIAKDALNPAMLALTPAIGLIADGTSST